MPEMKIASQPADFNSLPKWPPVLASPQPPVRGDLHTAIYREPVGVGVPVSGPAVKPRIFSGPNGSMPPF